MSLGRAWLFRGLLLVAVGVLAPGCGSSGFVCGGDSECGLDGVCQAPGYCSFPDTTCESGLRFGGAAGDFGGECVPAEPEATSETAGEASSSATGPTTATPLTSAGTTSATGITTGAETMGDTETTFGSTQPNTSPLTSMTGVSTDVSTTSTGPMTTESSSSGQAVERVTDGLLVLYRFGGMPTTTVADVSGVAPPLDLDVVGPGFSWTADGLVNTSTNAILLAPNSPDKIHTACQATNALTMEAWVSSVTASHNPSRLITYSSNTASRNFTLGVEDDVGVVSRIRTDLGTKSGVNGLPQFIANVPFAPGPTHLVVTHSAGGTERIYVDGELQLAVDRPGVFDVWDPGNGHRFALGNEITLGRPWIGTFHLTALYDRALSDAEVDQNFAARF